MTVRQLKELYAFAELEFSTEKSDLSNLKKILLLELKSASEGFIEIQDTNWTKNDILSFFDGELSDSNVDLQALEEEIPDLKLLRTPMLVIYAPDFKGKKAEDMELQAYGESEAEALYPNYKRAIKSRMDENYFSNVNYLLAFLPLFDEQKQFELARYIKVLFESKFLDIKTGTLPKKHALYHLFSNAAYYQIILRVANDDINFITDQLLIFETLIPKMKWAEVRVACDRQSALDQLEENYEWLRSVKQTSYHNARVDADGGSSKGFNVVWAVIVVLIFIIRSGSFFNNNSTPKYEAPNYDYLYENNPQLKEKIDQLMKERGMRNPGLDTNRLNQYIDQPDTFPAVVVP